MGAGRAAPSLPGVTRRSRCCSFPMSTSAVTPPPGLGLSTEIDEAAGPRARATTVVWNPEIRGRRRRRAADPRRHGRAVGGPLLRAHAVRGPGRASGEAGVLRRDRSTSSCTRSAPRRWSTWPTGPAPRSRSSVGSRRPSPATTWAVGTEVHLVNRLAAGHAERGVNGAGCSASATACAPRCSASIAQHLLWVLDNLAEGRVVNRVTVEPQIKPEGPARLGSDDPVQRPEAAETGHRRLALPTPERAATADRGEFPIVPPPLICGICLQLRCNRTCSPTDAAPPTPQAGFSANSWAVLPPRCPSWSAAPVALFEGADLPASDRAILASVGLQGGETLQVRQSGDSCVIPGGLDPAGPGLAPPPGGSW